MSVVVEDPPRPSGMDPRLRQRRIEVRRAEGRRRLRRLLIGLGAVAAAALLWALTYSSVLDIDHLEVPGLDVGKADAVRQAAAVDIGAPILYLDSEGASTRVEALPWVESAGVHRSLPGTVTIDVVERRAVVAAPTPEGAWRLLDVEGHAIADVPAPPLGVLALLGPVAPPDIGAAAGEPERAAITASTMLPAQLRRARRRGGLGRGRHRRATTRTRGRRTTRPPHRPSREVPVRACGARRARSRRDDRRPRRARAASTRARARMRGPRVARHGPVTRRCHVSLSCIDLVTMLDLGCPRPVQRQAQPEVDITINLKWR